MLGRVHDLERGAGDRRRVLLPHQHLRPAVDRGECIPQLVVDHREEPLPGPMQSLHLLQEPGAFLVMPHILDRARGRGREQDRDVLVLPREQLAAGLLGEVKVPDHTTPADDRDTQERAHRRVVRGKPVGVGVLGEIRQPDRLGLANHEAEDAMAAGRLADAGPEFRVDPVGGEALQDPSVRRDHSDSCVTGADHLGGHLHHAVQNPFERDLGDERRRGHHEPLEPFLR